MRIAAPVSWHFSMTSTVAVVAPNVARVDANARRARVGGPERHAVVEVDVGDQGHRRAPHDLPETLERPGTVY